MSAGGYIPGPEVRVPTRYIREVEPGLHVVSIAGGKPEYLISAAWMKAHPEYVQRALDAINELRRGTSSGTL